jgi:hypothetical protein
MHWLGHFVGEDRMVFVKALLVILRFMRRLLLSFLVGSELLLAVYSLAKLVLGGPSEMVGWWRHLQLEGSPVEELGRSFQWSIFVLDQIVIFALSAILLYFERRYQRNVKARLITSL